MRLDWELARRGYRRYAAYPGATLAGLFTNVFFGFLIAYILLALYERTDVVGGYDVRDAIAYVWLSQGLLSVVASFGASWLELAERVRSIAANGSPRITSPSPPGKNDSGTISPERT